MKKDSLVSHIQARVKALQQYRKELEDKRTRLFQQCTEVNEGELWPQISRVSTQLWECRGMQKVYRELQEYLAQNTAKGSAETTTSRISIEQISPPPDASIAAEFSEKTSPACPRCEHPLVVTTDLDPAAQPGYITISTYYKCQHCGYHETDRVDLPNEIGLQRYNLENLMKGV